MKLHRALISIALLLALAPAAYSGPGSSGGGGGWSGGGGGDLVPAEAGAAWFLGQAPVRYCIERAADFPRSEAELVEIVDRNVRKWNDYWLKNRAGLESLTIDFNFKYTGAPCDGTQDLRFVFGIELAKIPDFPAKSTYHDPFGFAYRVAYDPLKTWGSGLVWVANPAKAYPLAPREALEAIVLHELGHVFGNDHVPNTIMSDKLPLLISQSLFLGGPDKESRDRLQRRLTRIDGTAPLYFSTAGPGSAWERRGTTSAEAFLRLTGKAAQGKIHARLYSQDGVALELTDSATHSVIRILHASSALERRNPSLGNAFRVFRVVDHLGPRPTTLEAHSDGLEFMGTLSDATGGSLTVLVNVNFNGFSVSRTAGAPTESKDRLILFSDQDGTIADWEIPARD